MRKAIGGILIGLGIVSMIFSNSTAHKSPNLSHLVGTFLPGLFFIICGAALCRPKKPPSSDAPDAQQCASGSVPDRSLQFGNRADIGVLCGIVLMLMGSALSQQNPEFLVIGIAISAGGWALLIWGAVNYVRWKGYSGWLGLFAYLLVPGLIVLALLPNKRKQMLRMRSEEQIFEEDESNLARETNLPADQSPGYRYLLLLVPLALLALAIGNLFHAVGKNVDSAAWQTVSQPELGFDADMPGTVQHEQKIEETPSGNIATNKFTVKPKGGKELFMIVLISFPDEVGENMGGPKKILEVGRKDILAAADGEIKSEKEIVLNGFSGLELEVLPSRGAVVKAQVFASDTQLYEVFVSIPKARLESEDVHKFFNSIKLKERLKNVKAAHRL